MNEEKAELRDLRKENAQLRSLLHRIHVATRQFYAPKEPKADNCPYDEIVALYRKILGGLPQPTEPLTSNRKTKVRARWNDSLTTLADWEAYFKDASTKPFLFGANDRGWKADFDFFIREDPIARMQEGKYD